MNRSAIRVVGYAAAGLLAPVVWTIGETHLVSLLPVAPTKVTWRTMQFVAGCIVAVLYVVPFLLGLRPTWPGCGVAFVVGFVLLEIATLGVTEDLGRLFALPDTWSFLVTAVLLIWLGARAQAKPDA